MDDDFNSNPTHWPVEQVLRHSALNGGTVTEASTPEEVKKYRFSVWAQYIKGKAKKRPVNEENKLLAKQLYKSGMPLTEIATNTRINRLQLMKWIASEADEWKREAPVGATDVADVFVEDAKLLVTAEEAETLSAAVVDRRHANRLLTVKGEEWMHLSTEDKKQAFELQLLRHGMDILGHLQTLSREEKAEAVNIKAFMGLISAKKELCPPAAEPAGVKPGQLHMIVMNGDTGLPPRSKNAKVRQIDLVAEETNRFDGSHAT